MSSFLSPRDWITNITTPISSEPIEGHEGLILANNIFHLIGGQILLPIFLLTLIFSGEIMMNPLLGNFCVSWILYSTVNLLLFYGGNRVKRNPPLPLCMIQASLNYGTQAMTVLTTSGVVLRAWSFLRALTSPDGEMKIYGWPTNIMIYSSYAGLLGFGSAAIVIGVNHPEDVGRKWNIFVCDLPGWHLATSIGWLCLSCGIIVSVLAVWTVVILVVHRQDIAKLRGQPQFSEFGLVLRTLVFLVYGFVIVVFSVLSVYRFNTNFLYMFTALVPMLLFFIFATRRQTIDTWRRWLHLPPSRRPQPTHRLPTVTVAAAPKGGPKQLGEYVPVMKITRPGLGSRPSEVSFLEQERISRKTKAPIPRRGWSGVEDAFEVETPRPILPYNNPYEGSMERRGESSRSVLTMATNADSTRPLVGREDTAETIRDWMKPDDSVGEPGHAQGDGKDKPRVIVVRPRPTLLEYDSEPFLPISARFKRETDGPF